MYYEIDNYNFSDVNNYYKLMIGKGAEKILLHIKQITDNAFNQK